MADGRVSYPSVFVVDGGTGFPPPLPPKPGQSRIRTPRTNLIQNLLLVLVCLALCGLLVEGCFIYQLHQANQSSQATLENVQAAAQKGGREAEFAIKNPKRAMMQNPSKPIAHLSAGSKKPGKDGIMEWSLTGDFILYELEYGDRKLIVREEGYYYVYSKLSYNAERAFFVQTVQKNTTRYLNKPIPLLTYSRHNANLVHKGAVSNSYLGGVFYLFRKDAVFVQVNNGSLVQLHTSADNFFGMFML